MPSCATSEFSRVTDLRHLSIDRGRVLRSNNCGSGLAPCLKACMCFPKVKPSLCHLVYVAVKFECCPPSPSRHPSDPPSPPLPSNPASLVTASCSPARCGRPCAAAAPRPFVWPVSRTTPKFSCAQLLQPPPKQLPNPMHHRFVILLQH
jgi:hypothetical protein